MKKVTAAGRLAAVLLCTMGIVSATQPVLAKALVQTSVTLRRTEAPKLQSLLNGLHIPTYVWTAPTKAPKAVIVGLHGGCLQGRSYDSLAKVLAARGYTFVSLDMRGFGQWYHNGFGTKRDQTFHYDQSLNDIKCVVSRVRQACPGAPLYVLGESLGANVGVLFAADNPGLVDGVIASSIASPKLFLSPRMVLNAAQIITMPTSKIDTQPYLADKLSNNPVEIQEHFNDRFNRDDQSAAELIKSFRMNGMGKKAGYRLPPNMPLLVLAGAQDTLVGSPKKSLSWIEQVPVRDKQIAIFPEFGHLMLETKFIEPNVQCVLSRWLDAHSTEVIAGRARNLPASRKSTLVSGCPRGI